jgi:hypothetical protein
MGVTRRGRRYGRRRGRRREPVSVVMVPGMPWGSAPGMPWGLRAMAMRRDWTIRIGRIHGCPTEFWSVWYDGYGSTPKDSAVYDRRTWTILAHGGNGYNYYMAHGGSNFGYTNNDEDAASYDYGAAVGQAGDLRPVYYAFKRAAFFAHSFADVLENSIDGTGTWRKHDRDSLVRVTARHSPEGDLVFLDNRNDRPVSTTWAAARL